MAFQGLLPGLLLRSGLTGLLREPAGRNWRQHALLLLQSDVLGKRQEPVLVRGIQMDGSEMAAA
jgi:hypothetical protein